MLYQQTTEEEKYTAAVGSLAAQTLAINANQYKVNRATFLGLELRFQDAQGASQPAPQANLKLADRLTALDDQVVPLLQASARHKKFIEDEVNAAVVALGGFDKISETGEWKFVLFDATRDDSGKITGYSLPGLPFTYRVPSATPNQPGPVYSVNIDAQADGTGKPVFTKIAGLVASGDPL